MDHQILIDAEVAVPQGLEDGLRRVITAALAAEGESYISETAHIARGYEDIARDLGALGADIRWGGENNRSEQE